MRRARDGSLPERVTVATNVIGKRKLYWLS